MHSKQFLSRFGIAEVSLTAVAIAVGVFGSSAAAQRSNSRPISGPRANVTVSFGQWQTSPPLEGSPTSHLARRMSTNLIADRAGIKANGAVNFVIGGFHEPAAYGNGTQPTQIHVNSTVGSTGMPAGVPLINDPTNRVSVQLVYGLVSADLGTIAADVERAGDQRGGRLVAIGREHAAFLRHLTRTR